MAVDEVQLAAGLDEVARGATGLARGRLPEPAGFGHGWQKRVAEHVRALGEAWTDPAAWEGETETGGTKLSNELWGKIAFTEIVVHGWDLATATGRPFDLPDATLRACLDHVADFVPKAPFPDLWGPTVPVPDDAPSCTTSSASPAAPHHPVDLWRVVVMSAGGNTTPPN
ncbi:TIGR03086 family metal-binding protein [Actinomadura physcomitrii]|uniref:TIGR03086 family metal-binding protein n=1 Tax=Actinomadura physcomitrii TaxID=2650748 RepID=UPI0038B279CD